MQHQDFLHVIAAFASHFCSYILDLLHFTVEQFAPSFVAHHAASKFRHRCIFFFIMYFLLKVEPFALNLIGYHTAAFCSAFQFELASFSIAPARRKG